MEGISKKIRGRILALSEILGKILKEIYGRTIYVINPRKLEYREESLAKFMKKKILSGIPEEFLAFPGGEMPRETPNNYRMEYRRKPWKIPGKIPGGIPDRIPGEIMGNMS